MSKKYIKVKAYYDKGLWNEAMVRNAAVKGWITEDEAETIIGGEGETDDGNGAD